MVNNNNNSSAPKRRLMVLKTLMEPPERMQLRLPQKDPCGVVENQCRIDLFEPFSV
jgi:hypothetical protein